MSKSDTNQQFPFSTYAGQIEKPDGVGRTASVICGAFVRIAIAVTSERTIEQACFQSAACTRAVAAATALCESVQGLSTAAASVFARDFVEKQVDLLGTPEAGREHCAEFTSMALVSAIANHSDTVRAEWNGEDALICSCFGVSEQTILNAVQKNRLVSVEAVSEFCNAGAGCGSCLPLIADILEENLGRS